MAFRVWYYEEFKEMTEDQREDSAWKVPDERGIFDPSIRIPCDDVEEAARKYADYFHSERDGYENTWPIEFVVHDGTSYFVVSVDREFVPEFNSDDPVPLLPGPQ